THTHAHARTDTHTHIHTQTHTHRYLAFLEALTRSHRPMHSSALKSALIYSQQASHLNASTQVLWCRGRNRGEREREGEGGEGEEGGTGGEEEGQGRRG